MGLKVRSVPRTLWDARLRPQKLQREKLLNSSQEKSGRVRSGYAGAAAHAAKLGKVRRSAIAKKLVPRDGAADE
jgi:hypothetical protein